MRAEFAKMRKALESVNGGPVPYTTAKSLDNTIASIEKTPMARKRAFLL